MRPAAPGIIAAHLVSVRRISILVEYSLDRHFFSKLAPPFHLIFDPKTKKKKPLVSLSIACLISDEYMSSKICVLLSSINSCTK